MCSLSRRAAPALGLLALLLAALGPASPALARDDARIERVSFHARADGRGYVVRLHIQGRVGAYSVDQGADGTVELTLFQTRLGASVRRDAAQGPVRSYRLVPSEDRVVLAFAVAGTPAVQAYPDRASSDLLLALTTDPLPEPPPVAVGWGRAPVARAPSASSEPVGGWQEPGTRRTRPAPRGAPAPARSPSPPVASAPSPGGAAPAPWPGPRPPERAAGSTNNWRLDRIVLDAGHGGHDVGTAHHGVREKDVTLGIVRRLGRMLEQELGVQVVYTRADDRFVELHERGRIANQSGGKLFVSVHANAAGNASARGTETYFLAPHHSQSARDVMERENAVVRLESNPALYAEFQEGGGILRALTMSAYQEESQALAALIEREFGTHRASRGVKQAGFLVLWRASMPAVLVETGFVSNQDEGRYLASADGQEQLARSIFRALQAYKERYERALRMAASS